MHATELEGWLHSAEEKICGGVYLFEDEASVKAYLDCEIVKGLASNLALSNLSVKGFDVLQEQEIFTLYYACFSISLPN